MKFGFTHRKTFRWIGFIIALGIFVLTLFYSNKIVSDLKVQEEKNMKSFARAVEINALEDSLTTNAQEFILQTLKGNTTIPALIVDENLSYISGKNIPARILEDSLALQELALRMAVAHDPIEINGVFGTQYVVYENSTLLSQLRYYPIALIFIILIFVGFCFWYFKMLKETEQSFLWAGMAKETAHQIGTPLSSLMGWVELLKLEENADLPLTEMSHDLQRLNSIAERFSKIGSVPELSTDNLVAVVKSSYDYLKPRISKNISFVFEAEETVLPIAINPSLMSWVIENLVKNAVDAMQNKGSIEITVHTESKKAIIRISDDGPGIPKGMHKQIFEPGYTTKKRGWGLGLSLAKRIVQEYHKGKIFVARSDKTGTRFEIQLPL